MITCWYHGNSGKLESLLEVPGLWDCRGRGCISRGSPHYLPDRNPQNRSYTRWLQIADARRYHADYQIRMRPMRLVDPTMTARATTSRDEGAGNVGRTGVRRFGGGRKVLHHPR